MAEKDIAEKHLEAYNDVFADIVNVLLFEGQKRIDPGDLCDTKARSLYKAGGKLREQERDVSKLWVSEGIVISLIGFENQTEVDRDMPLRVLGYEGADYRWQLSSKKGLYPVLTLVLYFGEGRWTAPRSLFERIRVSEELRPFVSDHKVNVFEIAYLTDAQLDQFTSDFKIVADYFVQMRKNRDYVPSRQVVEHVDAVLKLMSVLTRDDRFEDSQNLFRRGESITMLSILDKVEARGEARGEAKCIAATARRMIQRGLSTEQIADFTELSYDQIEALRAQLH